MIGQCAVQFRNAGVGQPGVTEHDDRAHGVREAAQVSLLIFGECHGGIIVSNRNRK
jgi:hypothetical protein